MKLYLKIKNFTFKRFDGRLYGINWPAVIILSTAFGSTAIYQHYYMDKNETTRPKITSTDKLC